MQLADIAQLRTQHHPPAGSLQASQGLAVEDGAAGVARPAKPKRAIGGRRISCGRHNAGYQDSPRGGSSIARLGCPSNVGAGRVVVPRIALGGKPSPVVAIPVFPASAWVKADSMKPRRAPTSPLMPPLPPKEGRRAAGPRPGPATGMAAASPGLAGALPGASGTPAATPAGGAGSSASPGSAAAAPSASCRGPAARAGASGGGAL